MTLFWLLVGHAVADYPLQPDFLARGKNRNAPIPGVPWFQCLLWHAMIHAGAVALVTGRWELAAFELLAHFVLDAMKCDGLFGTGERAFHIDQALHVACKLAWACWLVLVP